MKNIYFIKICLFLLLFCCVERKNPLISLSTASFWHSLQKDQSRRSLSNTLQNKRKRSESQDETNDYGHNSSLYDDEEKPFQCNFCSNKYQVESTLKRHQNSHTHDKKYQCSQCDKYFFRSDQLKTHIKTHQNKNPCRLEKKVVDKKEVVCDVCSKKYTRQGSLTRHKRIHTHKKKYRCSQCHMEFLRADHLTAHTKTHEKKKKFVCDVCSKKYTRQGSLTRHQLSTSHLPECPYCLNSFPNLLDLRKHIELCKEHKTVQFTRVSVIQLTTKNQA